MCLIIDINVAEAVLVKRDDPNFYEMHRLLVTTNSSSIRLVIGGRLVDEYKKNKDVLRILAELDRKGRVRTVPNALIEAECAAISKLTDCKSNDVHILALARVGKVRLLCSNDQALRDDFNNKAIIDKSRGKVYSNPAHNHLLVRFCKSAVTL